MGNLWMIALIWLRSYSQTISFRFSFTHSTQHTVHSQFVVGNIGTWFRYLKTVHFICDEHTHVVVVFEIIENLWRNWSFLWDAHYVNHQNVHEKSKKINCDILFESLLAFCMAFGHQYSSFAIFYVIHTHRFCRNICCCCEKIIWFYFVFLSWKFK